MRSCIVQVIFSAICWIVGPTIGFLGGYVLGVALQFTVGEVLSEGLNYLFGTTRFYPEVIPAVCGALAVVSLFFKHSLTISKKG